MASKTWKLIGDLPKIGIRPAIDGRRRGVRESLEGQVMDMAKLAGKFLTAKLRYPNGQPVECVIADSCIGGVAEDAACADKFRKEGVGISLTVTPCWCYGSETMDMDPLMPKAVWGFNGTERPGAVYLAAVLAGHNQKGLPAFGIYGRDVQDKGDQTIPSDVQEKLLRFARAGLATAIKRVTGHKLTGPCAGGLIHLINSGAATLDGTGQQSRGGKPAMKPFWEITEAEAAKCLKATTWPAAVTEYFRGGGFSSCYLSKGGMPMTMTRISTAKGLGPILQIAEGWSVEIPAKVHTTLVERTNATWPTTWFAPRVTGRGPFADVYSVMNNWSANHGAISYGHIGADLIALAATLRIPVAMHNVAEGDVFRPSAWGLFGAQDPQGADYRACRNFGPLYG